MKRNALSYAQLKVKNFPLYTYIQVAYDHGGTAVRQRHLESLRNSRDSRQGIPNRTMTPKNRILFPKKERKGFFIHADWRPACENYTNY